MLKRLTDRLVVIGDTARNKVTKPRNKNSKIILKNSLLLHLTVKKARQRKESTLEQVIHKPKDEVHPLASSNGLKEW